MMTTPRFTLHHAPRSRSRRILWLLEEAGVPFEIAPHDLAKATHKDPAYRWSIADRPGIGRRRRW
jgi:glutathione S-transferase